MNINIFIIGIFIGLMFSVGSYGQEYTKTEFNPDGWPIPDVQTAQAKSKDKKMLGNVQAMFELFVTLEKTIFNRISTNGETWAYLVDTDGEKPMEYMLIKTNKFGNFDTRIPAYKQFPIPEWVQK